MSKRSAAPADSTEERMNVRRYGKILVYPPEGRLIFATDFHGQIHDFRRIVQRFKSRLERGEDLYLLFAGDFVHGPGPGQVSGWLQRDESVTILQELEVLMESYPQRVHSLLGNHEHGHLGGRPTQKFYRGLDDDVNALNRRMGPRMGRAMRSLFSTFSLVALAPCGVVFSHAAPNLDPSNHEDLLREVAMARYDKRDPVVLGLLWPRCVHQPERLDAFLEAMRFKGIQPKVSAYGHEIVPEGVDRSLHKQIVVSTSFAIAARYKTFLELDLSANYSDPADLREGVELVRLYPERAVGQPYREEMLA